MPTITAREKVRLMQDGTVHALGLVLSSVAGLLLVPIMVRGLGAEAYGVWMASLAAIGIFGAFDLGLRLIVVRELAGELRDESAPLVRLLFWVHVAIGLAAGAVVAFGGSIGASRFHLDAQTQAVVPLVFLLGGASCFFDQVFLYVSAVWSGLRKFRLLNGWSVAVSIIRIILYWVALAKGRGLVAIAALHLGISAVSAIVGVALIVLGEPRLCPKLELPQWRLLREPLSFGVLSQAATSIASLQIPISTLLISVINGAAAVTPFTVGQKFPNLVSGLTWRTSEVFFPVASQQRSSDELDPAQFLVTITRWLVLTIVPAALGLFLLAPNLLQAWMGSVDPLALGVLRIASASVAVEILIPGAIQLLWGGGRTREVLFVNLATMAADVTLAVLLLPRLGPVGAAWSTLASTVVAVALLLGALRSRGNLPMALAFRGPLHRFIPALALALLPAFLLQHFGLLANWAAILAAVLLSVLLYVAALWFYTANADEKMFLSRMVGRG